MFAYSSTTSIAVRSGQVRWMRLYGTMTGFRRFQLLHINGPIISLPSIVTLFSDHRHLLQAVNRTSGMYATRRLRWAMVSIYLSNPGIGCGH